MASTANSNLNKIDTGILQKDARVVIIRTDWNASIVDELEAGCLRVLDQHGLSNHKVISVPGAVEIPFAIQSHYLSHQNKYDKPHAYIALACVVRGGTPHFDYVCKLVSDGVLLLNLQLPVPVIFGVLTVDNEEQARERIGGIHGHKGEEAALTALKMMIFVADNNRES